MHELHDQLAAWCGSNLPLWLTWTLKVSPCGHDDNGRVINVTFGRGVVLGEFEYMTQRPPDWVDIESWLARTAERYVTELRDRCDSWLLKRALTSTLPSPR